MQAEQKKNNNFWKSFLRYGLAGIVIGALAGYWIGYSKTIGYTRSLILGIRTVRENNQSYRFIYPLLLNNFGDATRFLTDDTLQKNVNNYVQSEIQNQNAEDISVVARVFPDGSRISVNSDDQYEPGSMLKVLIMMAYYREAELDPTILQKPLNYSKKVDSEVGSIPFHAPTNLTVGQDYKISDLMKSMIAESDNGAEQLLVDNVNNKILDQAYVDLGVPSPDTVKGDYTISAAQYGGFLRILYNSTYLTEQYSEQALEIMTLSTYKDGIVAGVPADVTVAHKYGERVDSTNSDGSPQIVELHDCGIVYTKNTSYELCVMTKGTDINKLTEAIKTISSMVYQRESQGAK